MNEPRPDPPEVRVERAMLDRSQQAARFLDLTRQRELDPDSNDGMVLPLVAARLQELRGLPLSDDAGPLAGAGILDDPSDPDGGDVLATRVLDDDADDIRIDPAAFNALRPGSVPPGKGLGHFSLDDDGDVFGDGNGFATDSPFGADDGDVF